MKLETFNGLPIPGPAQPAEVPGALIVLEGADGVGRTTQVAFLKEWLESEGFAVADTGLMRSRLAGRGVREAKEGNSLGPLTMDLLYATDLMDRVEDEIVPALRAGFVVLADRYVYSLYARAIVRGADPGWIRGVHGFAIRPSAVVYLQIDVPSLVPRVLGSGGFNYWESGMDFLPGQDLYLCFLEYQRRVIEVLDGMVQSEGFLRIDASQNPAKVYRAIQKRIEEVVVDMRKARGDPAPLPSFTEPALPLFTEPVAPPAAEPPPSPPAGA